VPAFVKTEFRNFAIPYGVNSDGTFDYGADNNPANNNIRNMVKAGIGLQALFYGDQGWSGRAARPRGRNAANLRWNAQASGDSYRARPSHAAQQGVRVMRCSTSSRA
jgi:hypothetical protein